MIPPVIFVFLLPLIIAERNALADNSALTSCQGIKSKVEFGEGERAEIILIGLIDFDVYEVQGPKKKTTCEGPANQKKSLGSGGIESCQLERINGCAFLTVTVSRFVFLHAGTWRFNTIWWEDDNPSSSTIRTHSFDLYITEFDKRYHGKTFVMREGEYMVIYFERSLHEIETCILENGKMNEQYNLNEKSIRFPSNNTDIRPIDSCGFRMLVEAKTATDWSLFGQFGWTRQRAVFKVIIDSSTIRNPEKLVIDKNQSWAENFDVEFFRSSISMTYWELESPDGKIVQPSDMSSSSVILSGITSDDGGIWKIRAAVDDSVCLTEEDFNVTVYDFPVFWYKWDFIRTVENPYHQFIIGEYDEWINGHPRSCTLENQDRKFTAENRPRYFIAESMEKHGEKYREKWNVTLDYGNFHLDTIITTKTTSIGRSRLTPMWHSFQKIKYTKRGDTLKVRCVTSEPITNCTLESPKRTKYILGRTSVMNGRDCSEPIIPEDLKMKSLIEWKHERFCGCTATIGSVRDEHNGNWTCEMTLGGGLTVRSIVQIEVSEYDLISEVERTNSTDEDVKFLCRIPSTIYYKRIGYCEWVHPGKGYVITNSSANYIMKDEDRVCSIQLKDPRPVDVGKWICRARLISGRNMYATFLFSLSTGVRDEQELSNEVLGILDGIPIGTPEKIMLVGDILELPCTASISNFTDEIVWQNSDFSPLIASERLTIIKEPATRKNYRTILHINPVEKIDTKTYTCSLVPKNKDNVDCINANYTIRVRELQAPIFCDTNMSGTQLNFTINEKDNLTKIILKCHVDGIPKPVMSWEKDGMKMVMNTKPQTNLCNAEFVYDGQELHIEASDIKCSGQYQCEAENYLGATRNYQTVNIEKRTFLAVDNVNEKREQMTNSSEKKNPTGDITQPVAETADIQTYLLVIFILISIVCFGILIHHYTLGRKRWEKKIVQTQLAKEFLNEVRVGPLNPDLLLHEQADFLPYREELWEYPSKNLLILKKLGEGNFGVIQKARAPNIRRDGKNTRVAVKKVLTYSESDLRALVIELRILANVKEHPNVVSLLGACTKNVPDKSLWIILEYCRFGSLKDYINKHKSKFVHQFDPIISGKVDPSLGRIDTDIPEESTDVPQSAINTVWNRCRAFVRWVTLLNRLIRKRLNGKSTDESDRDYGLNDDGELRTPRPSTSSYDSDDFAYDEVIPGANEIKSFSTGDLLMWALQVARGMKFLSESMVLHGDLAARNVLLTENRTAKICDFGLARSIPKAKGYYRNQTNKEVPVFRLAIESLREKKYSTQTDVWSFGIVLWELFNLGGNPYEEILDEMTGRNLLKFLLEGGRLQKPSYATEKLFEMMLSCWRKEPDDRPSFNCLAKKIETMLNGKTH